MVSTVKTYWQDREPREQILLIIMGVLLGLFILWQFILSPLAATKQDAQVSLATAERDYVAVSRALPGLNTSGASTGESFNQAVFLDAARRRGLNPSRVQPDGNRSLTVWIDTQDTTALYGLIKDVVTRNGAVLYRAAISSGANQTLSAQLTFALTP